MKNFLSVLLWIPAIFARLILIAIGLPMVGFALAGDGEFRTPRLWRLFGDVELAATREAPPWSYAYPPLIGLLAWHSYSHWYAPVTIYLIFTLLGGLIALTGDRWDKFWEMAIRNPTGGLARKFTQPILEPRPNPDALVRDPTYNQRSAHRFLRHGLLSEYWYIRKVNNDTYFEIRIGWKYADGTPGFTPTISIRMGN